MLPSVPNKVYQHSTKTDAIDIPLDALDPETSRLLPSKKRTHRVWVQGRLAPVRTVSTASLRNAPPKYSDLIASRQSNISVGSGRRRSLDDAGVVAYDDEDEDSDGGEAIRRQTTQLRGYGIGGAGNIRMCPVFPLT